MRLYIFLTLTIFCTYLDSYSNGQNWQGLSNSNIDIQSFNYNSQPDPYYDRKVTTSPTTSTTTEPPSTTKKGGFFSGIKKIFGGGSKSTVEPTTATSTTTSTTTTAKPRVQSSPVSTTTSTTVTQSSVSSTTNKASVNVVTSSTTRPSNIPISSTTIASRVAGPSSSPTTQRTTTTTDPWPALPPIGGQSGDTASRRGSTPTTKPAVQFIPRSSTTVRPGQQTTSSSTKQSLATDAELATLSEALFNKDTNNVYRYVTVNHQGRTQSSVNADEAAQKLLTVDEQHVFNVPTIEKFRVLLNNYERDYLVNEYVTPIERIEENDFIEAVTATSVMRHAMNFLQQKNIVGLDPKTHKELLKTIWFNLYSRGQGKLGSSGFEHVFVSEIKNGTLSGLHNWLYYYDEEKAGHVDYKGFMKKLPLGNKGEILKLRMCVHISPTETCKPTNSMFIGTSPELEMALYTICFMTRPDQDCPITFNEKTFNIKTHTFRYRGKNLIGSAFPEI